MKKSCSSPRPGPSPDWAGAAEAVRRGARGGDARAARPRVPRPALARSADHRADPARGPLRTPPISSRNCGGAPRRARRRRSRELAAVGDAEAKAIRRLLEDQRARVAKADAEPEDPQLTLFDDAEAEQRRRDRRRWKAKLEKLAKDIAEEPERVRAGYDVVADRLETIGLVYLWPEGN